MATTTLKSLLQLLGEAIGDHLTFDTTTNIGAGTSVISTTLRQYDNAQDGYFDDWWLYIDGVNNDDVLRKTGDTTYATATGTLSVYGANLSAETAAVTCYLHRFSRDNKKRALNRSVEQVYPALHRKLEDRTLVTGNILPDNSFELWASSTNPTMYSGSANATLTRTTTAGSIRGALGTTSMKVAAGAADQYAYIDSDDYPRLLDLKDKDIDMKVWAKPSAADDAFMDVVYTKAGATTTVSSTTSVTANYFTLIERENISIPDDIEKIEFRFRVHTNGEDCYFDSARVNGMYLKDYMLLSDFDDGDVQQVFIQTAGHSDDICDDIAPRDWSKPVESDCEYDGTYKYLHLKDLYTNNRQIKVVGTAPLSTLSSDTDTIEIDGQELNLIVAKAAAILYRLEQGPVSSEDKGRYFNEIREWEREYIKLLPQLCMGKPSKLLWTK